MTELQDAKISKSNSKIRNYITDRRTKGHATRKNFSVISSCHCIKNHYCERRWVTRGYFERAENHNVLEKLQYWKKADRRPPWQDTVVSWQVLKAYWTQLNSLVLEKEALIKLFESDDKSACRMQVVVLRNRGSVVLRFLDDGASSSHVIITNIPQKVRGNGFIGLTAQRMSQIYEVLR